MPTTQFWMLQSHKIIDTRGCCSGSMLLAKQGIVGARVGEIVAVLTADSRTERDLPLWTEKMGHEFLGIVEGRGYVKLFVRRLH
jgi:TusA-related sulfurtransferase